MWQTMKKVCLTRNYRVGKAICASEMLLRAKLYCWDGYGEGHTISEIVNNIIISEQNLCLLQLWLKYIFRPLRPKCESSALLKTAIYRESASYSKKRVQNRGKAEMWNNKKSQLYQALLLTIGFGTYVPAVGCMHFTRMHTPKKARKEFDILLHLWLSILFDKNFIWYYTYTLFLSALSLWEGKSVSSIFSRKKLVQIHYTHIWLSCVVDGC